jgi:hypothetical protein
MFTLNVHLKKPSSSVPAYNYNNTESTYVSTSFG